MPLATRIIPVVLVNGRQAVKGKQFEWQRPIGQLAMTVRVYSRRMVDELALLSVSGSVPDVDVVRDFADACFSPLLVGGGISDVEEIRVLLANGADKVAVNTAAVRVPSLIEHASRKIGRQSLVVSIDVKGDTVHVDGGRTCTGLSPVEWASDVERLGAGEILLNRVERDGTMTGYDVDLVRDVSRAVSIPVIACGGAGTYTDMSHAIEAGAHAVAAGAMWSFTDATPREAARRLAVLGVNTRIM